MVGCLLAFYITPYFSTSLAFASSDLAVYAMLLTIMLIDLSQLPLERMVTLAAVFGAVIAYVEFLTGQAPLALALLLSVGAASMVGSGTPGALAGRYLWTAYAFVAGLVLCFAIKMAALLLIGADTGCFGSCLVHRMGGAVDGTPVTILYALQRLGGEMAVLGQGSPKLGLSLFLVAIAGLAGGACARWLRLPGRLERIRTAALLGAAFVIPARYLVFLNHTIIHAWFMIRPLVGFIAIGIWFGCSELAQAIRAAMEQPHAAS